MHPSHDYSGFIADSWLANRTSKIYGMEWRDADMLWDSNSTKFREYETKLCGQVNIEVIISS